MNDKIWVVAWISKRTGFAGQGKTKFSYNQIQDIIKDSNKLWPDISHYALKMEDETKKHELSEFLMGFLTVMILDSYILGRENTLEYMRSLGLWWAVASFIATSYILVKAVLCLFYGCKNAVEYYKQKSRNKNE